MQKSELQTRITDLEQRIAEFPAGSVTKKTISGRVYFYRRWTEDKKRKEKYIPMEGRDCPSADRTEKKTGTGTERVKEAASKAA